MYFFKLFYVVHPECFLFGAWAFKLGNLLEGVLCGMKGALDGTSQLLQSARSARIEKALATQQPDDRSTEGTFGAEHNELPRNPVLLGSDVDVVAQ